MQELDEKDGEGVSHLMKHDKDELFFVIKGVWCPSLTEAEKNFLACINVWKNVILLVEYANSTLATYSCLFRDDVKGYGTRRPTIAYVPTKLSFSGKNSARIGTLQSCFRIMGFTRLAMRWS